MMIKLPFEIKAPITTECWTYYKMGIIAALKCGKGWIAAHMEIFMRDMAANFGKGDAIYPIDYYNEILQFEEIVLWDVPPENLISTIIEEISKGNYILIDTNIHETLIYGYDEEKKIFFVPWIVDNKFKEIELPFDTLKSFYINVWQTCLEKPELLVERQQFQYVFTRVRVRQEDYISDREIYQSINKIRNEIEGKKYLVFSFDNTEGKIFYSGNACLQGMAEGLSIEEKEIKKFIFENPYRITKTLHIIYEHQNILSNSLLWLLRKLGNNKKEIIKEIERYQKLVDEVYNLFFLSMKGEKKFSYEIWQYIAQKCQLIYIEEKVVLNAILEGINPMHSFYKSFEYHQKRRISD